MGAPLNPQLLRAIRNVDIFKNFAQDDIVKIFAHCRTMNVQKDQMVFQKGTVGNIMFVVLGGSFGLWDGERQLATFQAGDTFGEMSLLLQEPRVGTVKALEFSQVCMLDDNLFQKLLTKRVAVQLMFNIAGVLARRLQHANKTLREVEGR
jgi:CRP/FNR family cyclic AMP-dependent transcriptional regulator